MRRQGEAHLPRKTFAIFQLASTWVPSQIVVDDHAAVLKILAFGKHIGTHQNVDLLLGQRVGLVGHRCELSQNATSLVGMIAAIDAANQRRARSFQPCGVFAELLMNVAARVLERAENQNLLADKFLLNDGLERSTRYVGPAYRGSPMRARR